MMRFVDGPLVGLVGPDDLAAPSPLPRRIAVRRPHEPGPAAIYERTKKAGEYAFVGFRDEETKP